VFYPFPQKTKTGLDYVDLGWEFTLKSLEGQSPITLVWDIPKLSTWLDTLGYKVEEDFFCLSNTVGGVRATPRQSSRWAGECIYLNIYLISKDITFTHETMKAGWNILVDDIEDYTLHLQNRLKVNIQPTSISDETVNTTNY
jgi:hypothetical protein